MIRVLLIDDHLSFRQPLAFIVDHQPDMQVVGQSGSVSETRKLLEQISEIDVAVVDLELPDGSGIELFIDLRRSCGAVKILVLSGMRREQVFADAVAAGASGIVRKSASVDEILGSIRKLNNEEQILSSAEISAMIQSAYERQSSEQHARDALTRLTPREREVLQALADGLSDRDIAERLYVSSDTVRRHMTNLLTKLEVDSRLQALVFAIRHGAVTIGD